MLNIYRCKSREFTEVIKGGKKVVNSEFVIFYFPNQLNNCQVGISVPSKLVKDAVRRNYYKRQVKGILAEKDICQGLFSGHYSLVIIVRSGFLAIDQFLAKKKSLTELLNSIFTKKTQLKQSAEKRISYV